MDDTIYQSIVIGIVVGIAGAIGYCRGLRKRRNQANKENR